MPRKRAKPLRCSAAGPGGASVKAAPWLAIVVPRPKRSASMRLEWFDLRNMLTVARAVAQSALRRIESRGAHQREDFPQTLPRWQTHQRVRLAGGALQITGAPAAALAS